MKIHKMLVLIEIPIRDSWEKLGTTQPYNNVWEETEDATKYWGGKATLIDEYEYELTEEDDDQRRIDQ